MRKTALFVLLLLSSCGAPSRPRALPPPSAAAAEPDPAPAPRADGRLPPGVAPTGYRIDLTLDPHQASFPGHVRIGLVIEQPTRAIVMHARGINVHLASITQAGAKQWAKSRLRMAALGKQDPEELVLVVSEPLRVGEAELDMEYEAKFSDGLRGVYRVDDGGESYIYSQFEPTDARRAFPCFDEPGFKVPFEIAVSVPEALSAVSNMPVARKTEQREAELVTYEFEKSPALPSYLVAIGVGPFDVLDGPKEPIALRVVAPRGKASLGRLAVDVAAKELAILEEYFGVRYPYRKLDLVAVPNFAAGAMENPGLITFREERLLVDSERVSAAEQKGLVGVLAHELSHQWFGDLVTMAWWDDVWLNEAFATWMGTKVVDRYDRSFGAGVEAIANKAAVMGLDAQQSARKVRQPVHSTSEALEAFDGITYVKGASVLGMTERFIGEEKFRAGVRSYLDTHAWKNATSADLFAALDAASGKSTTGVLDTFVGQTGVPEVSATLDCGKKPIGTRVAPRVHIEQTEYRPLGAPPRSDKSWRVPVCVAVENGKSSESQCLLLESKSAELELKRCPRFIWPNAAGAGYYRSRLPPDAFASLAKLGATALTEPERVALVTDAWALVKSGELEAAAYLDLVGRFGREQSRVVWEALLDALSEIERFLVPEMGQQEFRKWVVELVGPAARRLGWDPKPGESFDVRMLRPRLMFALGYLAKDAWANTQAAARVERWLADPKRVDGDVARVALDLRSKTGDARLFDALKKRMTEATTPEDRVIALGALSGFSDPALVERLLSMTLDGSIRLQDLRYVYSPLFERRETRDVAYRFVVDHFDQLSKRLPSFIVGRFVWVMASLCDEARVAEAEAFFRPRVEQIEGASKHLSQAMEAGRLCAAMASRQTPSVAARLASRSGAASRR